MVVTANRYASEAGLKILREGGNAVDAAIAVQLVLSLVEPQSSGPALTDRIGYERLHQSSLEETAKLLLAYLLSNERRAS